jgi:UDPglucose 6-dehydrogenase
MWTRKSRGTQGRQIPIHEPGLDALVINNQQLGRLQFTTNAAEGVAHSELIFLAVGTPPDEDGSADLQYVLAVARTIAQHMDGPRIVINKSTVPVGTADKVSAVIAEGLAQRNLQHPFDVVSNPSSSRKARPWATASARTASSSAPATRLPRPSCASSTPLQPQSRQDRGDGCRSAELTKYAANAMLATKISFMNEIANLAEKLGQCGAVRRALAATRASAITSSTRAWAMAAAASQGCEGADPHRQGGRVRASAAQCRGRPQPCPAQCAVRAHQRLLQRPA